MPPYDKMYYCLFNAITDALQLLHSSPLQAAQILRQAQQKAEELYLSAEE